MGEDLIRYDLLVQEALRGVVRRVLSNAARDGLPGAHYFHVEFLTAAPGVRLSDRMRERFPDRMTIILQHHFWDLEVTEEAVEVGLSFGGVGERVRVPFSAVTGFFDESVQFGLRFEVDDAGAKPSALVEDDGPAKLEPVKAGRAKIDPGKSAARSEAKAEMTAAKDAGAKDVGAKDVSAKDATPDADDAPPADDSGEGGAKVLSFNAFRKKT
ncbi:MAG: Stringent starvation protein B [Rhodoblastus sp.]|nr:MAG: Stringent starvation protein B [Rhodoblastus sp.]